MIRELRIYFRVKPYIEQLKELGGMPLSWNLCIQVLITISACIGAVGDLWPAKWVPYIATAQAIIQIILTNHAGKRNPDGKSATLAYNPATKKSVDFTPGEVNQ